MLSLEPFVHIEFHLLKTQATIASFPPPPPMAFCTHMETYRHIHTHAYPHVCTHTCIHTYTCIHMHTQTFIHTHKHTHKRRNQKWQCHLFKSQYSLQPVGLASLRSSWDRLTRRYSRSCELQCPQGWPRPNGSMQTGMKPPPWQANPKERRGRG